MFVYTGLHCLTSEWILLEIIIHFQGENAGIWSVSSRSGPLTRPQVPIEKKTWFSIRTKLIILFINSRDTFKTKILVSGSEPGPAPDTTAFIQRLEEEKRRQEKGEVNIDKPCHRERGLRIIQYQNVITLCWSYESKDASNIVWWKWYGRDLKLNCGFRISYNEFLRLIQ